MTAIRLFLGCATAFLATAAPLAAQQPPSYARDIRPFVAKYCLECHNAQNAKAGLDLETYKGLRAGSEGGAVVVAGKPDESQIVLLVEGKEKPRMPPKEAKRHPKATEIPRLRAWVAAGAKDDSGDLKAAIPDIKPRIFTSPPVTALAFDHRPSASILAVGAYREVVLLDATSGAVLGRLSGQSGPVSALAFDDTGHLAVAAGEPGTPAEVRLYSVSADGPPKTKLLHVLTGHLDVVHDAAFSPDGKVLATCGYDRRVKLWDTATGKELRTLKDHSDTVYSVAFSPDGQLLASGAADRAIKVWEVATGKLLFTLSEPTDWVYAVAWSRDLNYLASAGVDKSIRVWEVSRQGGKLIHSVFAHQAPVTRLAYGGAFGLLYSAGEDGVVKTWEPRKMVEVHVFPKQPETVLALAVRPGRAEPRLALGRHDGALLLIDEQSGKVVSQPLPIKPKAPKATKLSPNTGVRGRAVRITIEGDDLDGVTAAAVNVPGATVTLLAEGRTPRSLQADVTFAATTPGGVYQLTLESPAGRSAPLTFTLDPFDPIAEKEPNNSPGTGQKIALPATVVGAMNQTGDVDYYRFEAKAGQEIGVQVLAAAVGSKLEPYLRLTDASGQVLAESSDGLLGYTCVSAGTYVVGIRDRDYRGGGAMHYRLHIGTLPIITSVYPLGLERGAEADVLIEGVNLGKGRSLRVKAPADAVPGSTIPLKVVTPAGAPLNQKSVVVGEFPECRAGGVTVHSLLRPAPFTANGRILSPGATEFWKFTAKKGQRLIVEVAARRLGSPLDSYIEILDSSGKPVPRATLRSLAKTYVTFRDHDSASQGIRIEAWSELAINDYVLVGGELLRIRELPPNPDADCVFFSERGQRIGFLDTTPTHHAMGTPMYKVAIHPPGMTFPPNGFPVVTLYYRNDDGGPGYGRDSRLFFDPPADGDYQVRIGDTRGQGGSDYAYRLTVRPPRPSFNVSFTPTAPAVSKGGAVPITVTAERFDGYDGEIGLRLENLPPGFRAPVTSIPAGENSTAFALYAEPKAKSPGKAPSLKLTARARIDGLEVVKEVTGGLPKVIEPGDIVTTTDESAVTVRPGGETRLTVRVERRNSFKGRIPLEVRGLPHGVRVLDIGLNGILLTERDTVRTVVIYAEPWVQPREHPFVVLARREGTNAVHAAPSVLLKVSKAP